MLAVIKQIFSIALPSSFSMFLRTFSMFIAVFMVARLGILPLAGLGLGFSYFFTLLLFGIGLTMAVGILCGKNLGKDDHDAVANTVIQSVWYAVFLSIFFIVLLLITPIIFHKLKQDPAVVLQASIYLKAMTWGIPPLFFFLVFQQFIMAMMKSAILHALAIVNFLLTLLGYYLFIEGHYGFPKLGVAGVAYAFDFSAWVSLGLMLIYIYKHPHVKIYNIFSNFKLPHTKAIMNMLLIGLPIGINLCIDLMLGIIFVTLIGIIAHQALAAFQVIQQFQLLPLMIAGGINQAMMIILSYQISRNHLSTLKTYIWISMGATLIIVCIFSLSYILFSQPLILWMMGKSISAAEPSVVKIAVDMLIILAVFNVFDALRINANGVLRGMGDIKAPLIITALNISFVGLPLMLYITFTRNVSWLQSDENRVIALWLSVGLVITMTFIACMFRIKKIYKKIRYS